jgi:RNA polymerase sigma factor (sigma-70 family)
MRPALALGDDPDAVIAAARRGDRRAWERIYLALSGRVAGYLRLQGAAEPEDLTSEVFLSVFRSLHTFSGTEAQLRSWVFVIAHRRLVDDRRRRGQRDAESLDVAAVGTIGDTEEDALRELGTRHVEAMCAQLAPDQREVLLLRVVGDLSVEQVADVLGKTAGAVKSLQRRALAAIARVADGEGIRR